MRLKERPILFSAPMVRALLAGTKTQTRRVVKLASLKPSRSAPYEWELTECNGDVTCYTAAQLVEKKCPYGRPGDRLWVREAFALAPACSDPDPDFEDDWHVVYRASESDPDAKWIGEDGIAVSPWKPSIHMPRWASRITLAITEVRVQRLHDLTEEEARAEGVERHDDDGVTYYGPLNNGHACARVEFERLWNEINGADSWVANPWVWAISFKRVEEARRG